MQMTLCKIYFCNEQQTQKSRKWFFIWVLTQQFLSPSFLCITNRQKFLLLQKFNLTEFFVVVWWVYSVLTFQLDKLVKMSNNKNNRWIFWAPLDDAATKQKAHILVEMDARVSKYLRRNHLKNFAKWCLLSHLVYSGPQSDLQKKS